MEDPALDPFNPAARTHWIRLRTLVVLRWIAVVGQLAAITIVDRYFHVELELGLCYLAVGASIIANLLAILVFPENKRLSEGEVVSMLFFDISQLAFLLYLTGGLHNPFALLILVPVTISASALTLGSTLFLGAMSCTLLTLVAVFHLPLRGASGELVDMPGDFILGFWLALNIGIVFLAAYARRISLEIHSMSEALLATQMALLREQKLTDLGGVVAAAAHELGTPLATIKLVSSELVGELEDPDLKSDAELIRDQADRCRDILRSMGRAGKDDKHLLTAPLDTVIREAAEPHMARGKQVHFQVAPSTGGDSEQPVIYRKPEIIHGLRNLAQNAVDFAEGHIWVDANWTADSILIRIADDGAGFQPQVIGRLGDPFLRRRKSAEDRARRPEYEGMGLGLFIAKTLLERSGGVVRFLNGRDVHPGSLPGRGQRSGAIIEVTWPMDRLTRADRGALGENEQIRA
ncbi:sensor histidine kinase RegB [Mangrovicoccus algicola]|uniref:histidine kinase n=1 Tax=Mangrovicoccus algicola TaxID=2771008 RepID=A0A8J6YZ66_9RHOB|nr:ActS/PrrB/RegB family redox-sensitive histidine kinase [Mangrovicoccus algicola]MBE3640315.1 ActS/PrrB/RegB family redox-sensitive histidine kinase [Mangrovicoccus algicola]